jgi:hypothetical protein
MEFDVIHNCLAITARRAVKSSQLLQCQWTCSGPSTKLRACDPGKPAQLRDHALANLLLALVCAQLNCHESAGRDDVFIIANQYAA